MEVFIPPMSGQLRFLTEKNLAFILPGVILAIIVLLALAFSTLTYPSLKGVQDVSEFLQNYWRFFRASFLKSHARDQTGGQQGALENFYKSQAQAYDATRKRLLRGREEMLILVAAQIHYAFDSRSDEDRPVWIDLGGGTGYNIETMAGYLDVSTAFSAIYLVDLSPSLCDVARRRFDRLGWKNVNVVCDDASQFNLRGRKADLITMSYSLSMMPNFHTVIDSASSMLNKSRGVIAVVDFYVQSSVETSGRNYIGSCLQRHVNWLGRSFWRAWFDLDRVGLEGARRDYLEYRFGTLKTIDERNHILGRKLGVCIPYYIFVGRHVSSTSHKVVERHDASLAKAVGKWSQQPGDPQSNGRLVGSKAFDTAVINLKAKLPLPSPFYQNKPYRLVYDEALAKHKQFNSDFIYAFTWEDSRTDIRLLDIKPDETVLCITSAGDNLLDYIYSCNPRRLHAVDLNPNQNHLLELKVAAYQALPYPEFWKLFGEGQHSNFHELLVQKLSPYMSSHAFQFWWYRSNIFSSGKGLYEHGGSGVAIKLVRIILGVLGHRLTARKLCTAKTLNEQREIWPAIRGVLMSRLFHSAFLGTRFWWKAAGVPPNQVAMIVDDHLSNETRQGLLGSEGEAMWQYLQNTLDPIARDTLLSEDNFYYLLALQGRYTKRCHPPYVSAKAHAKLSRPGAFDSLRIHTDDINEIIAKMAPGTLNVAIIMDSMDWFDPKSPEALVQVRALNKVLAMNGRVLLRSAGLVPWYMKTFEQYGFKTKRMGTRIPGTCIDRVNMYASAWMATKAEEII
ncbi:MAG: hypothetical protein M1825_004652 [Sarcosagium campestre]|nr:MAG: hypothetical protein M1825_004652 [Sarcosagium campestre]